MTLFANAVAQILRSIPPRVADSVTSRFLVQRKQQDHFLTLFANAPLAAAPSIKMTLSSTDFMHAMIAFTGAYERDLTRKLVSHAIKGGNLVDVGANWGYFSLLWAAQNAQNLALAIEASPRNHAPLQKNIENNGLSQQIKVHKIAAGAVHGTMPFDPGEEGIYGWGGFATLEANSTIDVPVAPIDDLCIDLPVVDVLKIDVEGAEAIVLEGAKTLLRKKKIKNIYLELNDARMRNLGIKREEPQLILESFGYKCSSRGDDLEATIEPMG